MNRIIWEVDTTSRLATGAPNVITIRPIRQFHHFDDQQAFRDVGNLLRNHVTNELRQWDPRLRLSSVSGNLQMTNIGNGRSAQNQQVDLTDLNVYAIQDIFDRVLESGSSTIRYMYEVYFSYWINPNSYLVGRGVCEMTRGKIKGVHTVTTKFLKKKDITVTCAATAIVSSLASLGHYGANFQKEFGSARQSQKLFDYAYGLQRKMGWQNEVSQLEVTKVLANYPEYRIIFLQTTTHSSAKSTFYGQNYESPRKTIYLYLWMQSDYNHYYSVASPQQLVVSVRNCHGIRWCETCISWTTTGNCYCENTASTIVTKRLTCECGANYAVNNKHKCGFTQCHFCPTFYEGLGVDHRCPLISTFKKPAPFLGDVENYNQQESKTKVWVWDIESSRVLVPGKLIDDYIYETDENGKFINDENDQPICRVVSDCYKQVPNFIAYGDLFSDTVSTCESLEEFVSFMLNHNDGDNIVLAHNSQGYDTPILFQQIVKMRDVKNISCIQKGAGKFMQLSIGKTRFRDSMLHLTGSLRKLAKDFGIKLEKGYFPYLFDLAENIDYIGEIPEKKYFDLSFSISDEEDLGHFNNWYETQLGKEWNIRKEREKYCVNDVKVLRQVILLHHKTTLKVLEPFPHVQFSPWVKPTAAGFVHEIFLMDQGKDLPADISQLTQAQVKHRVETKWCALEQEEYYFARKALRGGRTEVRKHYYKGKIADADIQSAYPAAQMKKTMMVNQQEIEILYPVGFPQIEVFDYEAYPCNIHRNGGNKLCNCGRKQEFQNKKLKVIQHAELNDIHDYINNFDGVLSINATPPSNLYVPVLPIFDERTNKCLFSLEPIFNKVFTSVEVKQAIRVGYQITKIYRADRYKMSASKWRESGIMGELYKLKMYNSQKAQPPKGSTETIHQWKARIYLNYKKNYDMELDFSNWDKRPSLKQTGKLLCNVGWGKHAETVDHIETSILEPDQEQENYNLQQDFLDGTKVQKQFIPIGDRTMIKHIRTGLVKPNLHKSYLPCAIFVPAYTRLELFDKGLGLGQDILMMDTDSIKYVDKGQVFQKGDCLGDWEEEITECDEFVALGPKSYGQHFKTGESKIKCKGVSLKHAHSNLINFETYKEILFAEGEKTVALPQFTMVEEVGTMKYTKCFLKNIKFNIKDLKGDYNTSNYQVYPYGYR